MCTRNTTQHIKPIEFEVTADYIRLTVHEEVINFLLVLFTNPRHESHLETVEIQNSGIHMNSNLIHVVPIQFFEGTDLQCVLEVDVVITWNDVHGDPILTQLLKEVESVGIQCFVVYEPSVLERIAQVDDVLDFIFEQVGKEHLGIEVVLILYKNVRRVPDTCMCVVKEGDFQF